MSNDTLPTALTELRVSLERFRVQIETKDAEIRQLREALAEREARVRALGDQALHLLDLLHESRAELAARKNPA